MNNHPESRSNKIVQEDEIDLLELAKRIWSKRKFILKITGIFLFLGVIIAFTSKVEYEASCKLMPENQEGIENSLGGLSGLAGLAGINLDMMNISAGELNPALYPEIVQSVPFQMSLMHEPVRFEKIDSTISSYHYFKEIATYSLLEWLGEYSIGLPEKIRLFFTHEDSQKVVGKENILRISKEDWKLIEDFKERFSISAADETGILTITAELPDAYAAAMITDLMVKRLTEEITTYKIQKVRVNLEFTQERYLEAEQEYEAKQKQLARFTDRNKNLTSSLVQTEYQRLENEMNIAFEVYKGLATQLEQAKIKVKEETPVFTILEPVSVPVEKSKPKRGIIIIISVLIGFFIGSCSVFTMTFFQFPIKEKQV